MELIVLEEYETIPTYVDIYRSYGKYKYDISPLYIEEIRKK